MDQDSDGTNGHMQRILALAPRLASFDADDYLALNPDLHGVDLNAHFAEFGVWEGRKSVAPERLTARLARAMLRADSPLLTPAEMERGYRGAMRVAPVLHQSSSATDLEILAARQIAAALEQVGLDVAVTDQTPGRNNGVDAIVIDPSGVFEGPARTQIGRCSAAVMLARAAPDHPDFAAALPYLAAGGAVIALESETCALFKAAGTPSVWLGGVHSQSRPDEPPMARHPLFRGLSRAVRDAPAGLAWGERPIDVAALEPRSSARIHAWARMADRMAGFMTLVYQPEPGAIEDEAERVMRRHLYARSKIVLHLHGETPGALPTSIIEEATAAGAVVLSEPCAPHPLLTPGRHYFESSARRMPDAVAALIQSPQGVAGAMGAVSACERALSAAFDLETVGLALVNLLLDAREARA